MGLYGSKQNSFPLIKDCSDITISQYTILICPYCVNSFPFCQLYLEKDVLMVSIQCKCNSYLPRRKLLDEFLANLLSFQKKIFSYQNKESNVSCDKCLYHWEIDADCICNNFESYCKNCLIRKQNTFPDIKPLDQSLYLNDIISQFTSFTQEYKQYINKLEEMLIQSENINKDIVRQYFIEHKKKDDQIICFINVIINTIRELGTIKNKRLLTNLYNHTRFNKEVIQNIIKECNNKSKKDILCFLNNNYIIYLPLLLYEVEHISSEFSTLYPTSNGRFFSFQSYSSPPIFYDCTKDNNINQIISFSDKQKSLKQLFVQITENTFLFSGSCSWKKINEITISDSSSKKESEFNLEEICNQYKNECNFNEISSINKYILNNKTICLIVSTDNGFLISINYTEKQIITIFKAHQKQITSITILLNGYCVTNSLDGILSIWSLPSFKQIKKYKISLLEHRHIIQIEDGRIVSNSGVNSFSVYNETFTEEIGKYKTKTLWEITSIEDLKRDNTIIIGTKVTAELWNLNSYECVYIFNTSYTVNLTDMSLLSNNKFIMGNSHNKIHLFLQTEEQSLSDKLNEVLKA